MFKYPLMNFLVSCLVVHVSHHSKDVYGGSNQFSWITLYSFIYNHERFTRVRCVQEQPYLLQSFSEKILVHHFLMPRLLPTKQMFSLNVRKRLGPVSVACLSELAMLKPMEVFLKTLLFMCQPVTNWGSKCHLLLDSTSLRTLDSIPDNDHWYNASFILLTSYSLLIAATNLKSSLLLRVLMWFSLVIILFFCMCCASSAWLAPHRTDILLIPGT